MSESATHTHTHHTHHTHHTYTHTHTHHTHHTHTHTHTTHSGYVIIVAFAQQQTLSECPSVLRYT